MKVSSHTQGTPSWFELSTTDPASAVSFYGRLFGWTDDPRPMPEGGDYHVQLIEGDSVAAIGPQMPGEIEQGLPPHWNVYIAVDDVDATTGKVEAGGGSVLMPAMDVMDVGRMSVIADPTGGVVCLWQAKAHIGAERVGEPGTNAWAELATSDPDRAAAFFRDLLGTETESNPMPDGSAYTVMKAGGQDVAGIFKMPAEMQGMPSMWTAYFGVENVDACIEQAQGLGAQVVVPGQDIPEGRFAVLADQQQAAFGIYQMTGS
ncbi:MAG: VOC family protein [Dehalococcoidia bacterium]|nr:VOC family protein [Dehalococcoidia bacterium]